MISQGFWWIRTFWILTEMNDTNHNLKKNYTHNVFNRLREYKYYVDELSDRVYYSLAPYFDSCLRYALKHDQTKICVHYNVSRNYYRTDERCTVAPVIMLPDKSI